MNDESVQIVTTADARYIAPLLVLAKSIELSLRTCKPAILYVIDGGLGWRNRRRLERTVAGGPVTVKWLSPPPRAWFAGVPVFGHVNINTYYRIVVPRLLPHLEKVIYLDADIIVLEDLGIIWRMPMSRLPLMAVPEVGATMGASGIPGVQDLGISAAAKVFNGGVLVLNLRTWRVENLSQYIAIFK